MKASVMQQKVVEAENELFAEISGIISARINALSAETGLEFNGMDVDIFDVTSVESVGREICVSGVSLDMSLPDKIRG